MGEARAAAADEEKVMINRPSPMSVEDAEVKASKPFYGRKSFHICCGTIAALLLCLIILILIFSFTIFKTKDPRITVTGMTLQRFSAKVDESFTSLILDVSLHLNVSVKNPNLASFQYANSSTYMFYREVEVGRASIPAGEVGAKTTMTFTTDLEIQALNLPFNANLTSDLQTGTVPVSTASSIRGRLNMMNIFKHNAVSTSACTATIFISNTTLKDFHCVYTLKI